jgi:hypothetical protein
MLSPGSPWPRTGRRLPTAARRAQEISAVERLGGLDDWGEADARGHEDDDFPSRGGHQAGVHRGPQPLADTRLVSVGALKADLDHGGSRQKKVSAIRRSSQLLHYGCSTKAPRSEVARAEPPASTAVSKEGHLPPKYAGVEVRTEWAGLPGAEERAVRQHDRHALLRPDGRAGDESTTSPPKAGCAGVESATSPPPGRLVDEFLQGRHRVFPDVVVRTNSMPHRRDTQVWDARSGLDRSVIKRAESGWPDICRLGGERSSVLAVLGRQAGHFPPAPPTFIKAHAEGEGLQDWEEGAVQGQSGERRGGDEALSPLPERWRRQGHLGMGMLGGGFQDVLVPIRHSCPGLHLLERVPAHLHTHEGVASGKPARHLGKGERRGDGAEKGGGKGGGALFYDLAHTLEKHSRCPHASIAPSVITRTRLSKNFAALCASRLQFAAEHHHFFGTSVCACIRVFVTPFPL